MCITFLFSNPGDYDYPKYRLILANNRDEFYSRATSNASLNIENNLQTIYGTDLAGEVKGTWLGLSAKNGNIKIGNLANITGEINIGKLGRGPIVTNWIQSDESIESYNGKLSTISQDFSSFNFLSVAINNQGDIKTFHVSNSPKVSHELPLGFVGLGNSPLGAPFKKVEAGNKEFKKVLEGHCGKDDLIESLMTMLKDDRKYFPDAELISRRHDEAEPFSSIHVVIPNAGYGTRTRTVILVDFDNKIDYVEETMTSEDENGPWLRTHLNITSHL